MTAPLLFVFACAEIADDGDAQNDAQSSTSDAAAADPRDGSTQDPRERLAPPAPVMPRILAAPTISPPDSAPGADFQLVSPNAMFSCADGTLCTGVWDPTVNKWKVFKLFFCSTYSLSNWNGIGFYLDKQTGNPLSVFYDQNMHVLRSFRPGQGQVSVNWDPVWFIKNC